MRRRAQRIRRRQEKEISRKTAVRKLRLPGKLADCTNTAAHGSEIFVLEGDSAGGSAKQARVQAVLPLRGKIPNVASAGKDRLAQNQQLSDPTRGHRDAERFKSCRGVGDLPNSVCLPSQRSFVELERSELSGGRLDVWHG